MTIEAWYMDEDTEADQRLPHKTDPVQPVNHEKLIALGVLFWENITGPEDPVLLKIREERGYNYTDVVNCCPDKLPGYCDKIKMFFEEHIHLDEEIRYCMDGSGYFDIRDEADRWIRIALSAGDLIVLPEGINHRFTNDEHDYIQAMRLFQGEPKWTPYNRKDIAPDHPSRVKYVSAFGGAAAAAAH